MVNYRPEFNLYLSMDKKKRIESMTTSRMLVQRQCKCGQDIVFNFKIDCSNGSVFLLLYLFPPHTPSLFALIALPCCCGSPRFSLKTHSERQDAVFFKHVALIRFF